MKATRNLAVWIILGLLIVGLMGFGATSFSGSASRLGSAGDKEISATAYGRALQNQMNALSRQTGETVSFQTLQQFGMDRQILAQLVAARALENEAAGLGLSVGDAEIAGAITENPAFAGPGGFDRANYQEVLRRAGMSEGDFEESIRDELSRALLESAVVDHVTMPDQGAELLLAWRQESRDLSWAALPLRTPDPASEADLRGFYDAHPDQFMAPEARNISIAALTPEMLIDEIELDEAALRELYASHSAEYSQPERRLLERLVFGDMAQAEAAAAQIAAGEADFESLVAARGLSLGDVDMGDVTQSALGADGAAVFAAGVGEVVGPVLSRVGPALFRVNGVLEAQSTSFEEALPELREELALARSGRVIDEARNQIEDLIAGGAQLEDLAEQTQMQFSSLTWSAGSEEGLAAYAAIADAIPALESGALPELIELEDGGLAALRLDELRAAALRPFEEVRDEAETAWRAAQQIEAARAAAQDLLPRLEAGEDFAALGLAPRQETGLTRRSFIEDAPREMIARAFAATPGDSFALDTPGGAVLVRIEAAGAAPMPEDARIAALNTLGDTLDASLADDLLTAFTAQVQRNTRINLDQGVLNAIHAQLQ